VVVWASRTAGIVGLITAALYLGLLLDEANDGSLTLTVVWCSVMTGAGLLALFADRFQVAMGRRMLWVAGGMFLVLGVLSIFSLGLLFLAATVLTGISLVWRPAPPDTDLEV
jgi:hypothetical protein